MTQLICEKCNAAYSPDGPRWRCDCGHFLDLGYESGFSLEKLAQRPHDMWRYREAIPLQEIKIPSFNEGYTPLLQVEISGNPVLIKQEQLFLTGSFKDRGAAVLINKVKSLGIPEVVADSSGNAGSAIAAYCAAAGITCHIYVPAYTSPGKLAQIQMAGAHLHKIPGTREDTARAILDAAKTTYYASHYWNPFFFHGTKTFAFEVCEQLGWKAPDTIILAVGNGSLLLGTYIGFQELLHTGIIDKIPRLIAVQPENCAPLVNAFINSSGQIPPIAKKKTAAEGIAVATPLRGKQIISAVKNTGGFFISVKEEEIIQSLKEICHKGFYIEPTSAATVAGIKKYLDNPQHLKIPNQKSVKNEIIVSAFTGHGLKTGNKMLEIQ